MISLQQFVENGLFQLIEAFHANPWSLLDPNTPDARNAIHHPATHHHAAARNLNLHARAVHDERVRDLQVTEAQFDEKWAFVGKKQKNCDPDDPKDQDKGDKDGGKGDKSGKGDGG